VASACSAPVESAPASWVGLATSTENNGNECGGGLNEERNKE
jgi:hypothetical protein